MAASAFLFFSLQLFVLSIYVISHYAQIGTPHTSTFTRMRFMIPVLSLFATFENHNILCIYTINVRLSEEKITSQQGGRTWQPFVGSKIGNENFRQAHIYNFRVKCVVLARNRKFAKLICNIYHVIVHFLPKKHCF